MTNSFLKTIRGFIQMETRNHKHKRGETEKPNE
jgi:hypothetical protein